MPCKTGPLSHVRSAPCSYRAMRQIRDSIQRFIYVVSIYPVDLGGLTYPSYTWEKSPRRVVWVSIFQHGNSELHSGASQTWTQVSGSLCRDCSLCCTFIFLGSIAERSNIQLVSHHIRHLQSLLSSSCPKIPRPKTMGNIKNSFHLQSSARQFGSAPAWDSWKIWRDMPYRTGWDLFRKREVMGRHLYVSERSSTSFEG
jgi:hypothetical protein